MMVSTHPQYSGEKTQERREEMEMDPHQLKSAPNGLNYEIKNLHPFNQKRSSNKKSSLDQPSILGEKVQGTREGRKGGLGASMTPLEFPSKRIKENLRKTTSLIAWTLACAWVGSDGEKRYEGLRRPHQIHFCNSSSESRMGPNSGIKFYWKPTSWRRNPFRDQIDHVTEQTRQRDVLNMLSRTRFVICKNSLIPSSPNVLKRTEHKVSLWMSSLKTCIFGCGKMTFYKSLVDKSLREALLNGQALRDQTIVA